MNTCVESTTRDAKVCFHFAITFFGIIIAAAGVVTVSVGGAICGFILIAFGLAYFPMESS
jgi:hypothetical protein